MADLNPIDTAPSTLKTNPPLTGSTVTKTRPAVYGQIGRSTSYISSGDYFIPATKPHYYQLNAWDKAKNKEPVIKDGLEKIVLAVLSKVGEYSHPDPAINDFVNANLENNIKKWIRDLTYSSLWAGFGVSEIIWMKRLGTNGVPQIWIDDILNYHPTQVEFRLNNNSRLTFGEKVDTSELLTGIWVPAPINDKPRKPNGSYTGGMIRLPRSKVIHTALGGAHNNPWGISQIDSVLEYHLFKEAFRDMMAVALDRYGSPLIYAIVPPQITDEVVAEPDGTTRNLKYREVVSGALQDLRSQQAIVLEQMNKEHPVTLGSLTTGNNFADTFTSAIDLCDKNIMMGLGIPNLIVRDERSGLGNGNSSENQIELYQTFISSIFDIIVGDFIRYAIAQLITYNFDPTINPKAYKTGMIKKLPFRYADTEVVINSVEKMTKLGYMNPANEEDFNHVRSLLYLNNRKPDELSSSLELTEATKLELEKAKTSTEKAKATSLKRKPEPTQAPANAAQPIPTPSNNKPVSNNGTTQTTNTK